MWKIFKSEVADGFCALCMAALTGLAALFGKRSHGGKVITFAGRRWLPECE